MEKVIQFFIDNKKSPQTFIFNIPQRFHLLHPMYRCHKHIDFKHMMTATLIDKLNTMNIKNKNMKNIIVGFDM